jgi:nucleotide-binding universal stress UspA family protein
MLRFKKILCPTDFSDPSHEGLRLANEIGSEMMAELYLVHVLEPIPAAPVPEFYTAAAFDIGGYDKELEVAAKKHLLELVDKHISKEMKIQTIVARGNAAGEIVRVAKEKKIDLIVISTHGRTGWRHLMFGSVAEKVVRLAPIPVLTVPQPGQED